MIKALIFCVMLWPAMAHPQTAAPADSAGKAENAGNPGRLHLYAGFGGGYWYWPALKLFVRGHAGASYRLVNFPGRPGGVGAGVDFIAPYVFTEIWAAKKVNLEGGLKFVPLRGMYGTAFLYGKYFPLRYLSLNLETEYNFIHNLGWHVAFIVEGHWFR